MKKKIAAIREIFARVYGEAACTLDYRKPYELLFATRLAAQCTDARVNIVMEELVKKYRTLEDFAGADVNELMIEIHSTGFFRNKAKDIIAAANMLIDKFGGTVPDTMEELLTLPGVGRKTANLVLGDVFGKPAIVVDTHAGRLARRIGLTKHKDPYKVELDLVKIIPPDYQSSFCHQLVYHGRACCKAQRPECGVCPIYDYCDRIL